ncbi:MAG: ferritin-like domain-containing protein [Candidatus Nanoarchaeia archaeon]|nr:ferritin-like domain-containing protein [Candidatus Nanoarchaeia archaeon]
MRELEILKKILNQEFEAESRYIEHINKIRTPIIRKMLKDLKAEESKHKRQLITLIKNLDEDFNEKEYAETKKILPEEPGTENFKLVQALLELDKEAEEESYKEYTEASNELDTPIREILIKFRNDEDIHIKKIKNLIDQLAMLNR